MRKSESARHVAALPYAMAYLIVPVLVFSAWAGGWALLLPPLVIWGGTALLDYLTGQDSRHLDPGTDKSELNAFRWITLGWFPVQFLLVFGLIGYASDAAHLGVIEKIALAFGIGIATGTVGINFSHELMHRPSRFDRSLADLLLAMVLYSHFRTEHLQVHHSLVGTPADAVTARYNEGFHRFFPRVLWQSLRSAWRAEVRRLDKRDRPAMDSRNPFWRYWSLQAFFLFLALVIGGWVGFAMFLYQAFIAVWQLELVNYVEHYGLTRRHLGDGRYEPVRAHHSWNANTRAGNSMLLNLQRHADHHVRPGQAYPLLQSLKPVEAPLLPAGYAAMTALAMWPPAWRQMMNPRVRAWRALYYPDINDWTNYNMGLNPHPVRR